MKPLLLLLGLSLTANAVLYYSRTAAHPPADATFSPAHAAAASTSVEAGSASATTPAATSVAATSPYAELWEKLRAGDASLVARLRAAGWPEDAIRALVIAQINDLFAARRNALTPDSAKTEYWKQTSWWSPQRQKAMRDLSREQQTLLSQLLGPDYTPERERWSRDRYAGLTDAQAKAVSAVDEDYQILTSEIVRGDSMTNRILLAEDREKLAYLEKERQADLAQLLSPAELLEYELRNSTTASTLRWQLAAFAPTEQEFRQIFALQNASSPIFNYGIASAAQREATAKNQAEIDAQIKKILSPERAADYERAKKSDYQRLHALTERLKLAPENAIAAYDVKTDIEKRLRELKPSADPDAKKTLEDARAALAQEAEQRLVASLGQRGLEAYKLNGAQWLVALQRPLAPAPQPRPAPAPATPTAR